jgi:hypothetical protein
MLHCSKKVIITWSKIWQVFAIVALTVETLNGKSELENGGKKQPVKQKWYPMVGQPRAVS